MSLEQQYAKILAERKSAGLLRDLPVDSISGVDFTNNDYLRLSRHPAIVKAAQEAAEKWGVGGKASRLLGAEAEVARELESKIAQSKSRGGSALVFGTGFQLNQTVISTLTNRKFLDTDVQVFTDRLVHASVHTGLAVSGVRQIRFQHNDFEHLEQLLIRKSNPDAIQWVIVESLYGMDGDSASMKALYELKARYGFHLYVDEAHAVGVSGRDGYGLAHQGVDLADVVIGTFSKAIGSAGGFAVCSKTVRQFLINFGGGVIYSTAPSPVTLAAANAAWDLVPKMDKERMQLVALASHLREGLKRLGYDTCKSDSHIVPIMVGNADEALELCDHLRNAGLNLACIRPPTVPPNTARLRVSLNCGHTMEQVDELLGELALSTISKKP